MSDESRVAKRYAAALFDVAERDNAIEAVLKDLTLVETYFEQVPYLKSLVMQPLVSIHRKQRVLSDAFGDRTTATTVNFLYLLVRKRRTSIVYDVIREFRAAYDENQGRIIARVQTAVEIDKKQLASLQQALVKRTGKKVELRTEIDPAMIAGVRVRLGDTVIDGSISGRLEKVRQQLLGAQ
ncbi:MAG: F0F1 ATP synthase subunit delta [Capsulimonadaceae bacterium]|nr:F0F1 ATP synthase subunit delta [Capsulimonadaceae bacterium]